MLIEYIFSNVFLYTAKIYNTSFNLDTLLLEEKYYYFFILAHLGWWMTYGIVHFLVPVRLEKKKDIYDTKTRIISILHASVIFWMSLYDLIFQQVDKCGYSNSTYQNYLMILSSSYFLYDLIVCIILECSDFEMVLHHISCISGYYASLAYNNSSNEIIRALIVTEISCPIMHLRVIIKNYNLKHTKSYFILDYIYMILYMLARIIYGVRVEIFTLFCWDNLLIVKIAGTFLWLQSFIFAKRMIGIIKKIYLEYEERRLKNVELFWFTHNKKVEDLDYYKKSFKKDNYVP